MRVLGQAYGITKHVHANMHCCVLGTSNPGISGLCIHTFGAMARSTLVHRCLARGTSGQCLFFNNTDDEKSWNIRIMHSYLSTLAKLRHMSLGAMARSTLVHRCLARGTCGQ